MLCGMRSHAIPKQSQRYYYDNMVIAAELNQIFKEPRDAIKTQDIQGLSNAGSRKSSTMTAVYPTFLPLSPSEPCPTPSRFFDELTKFDIERYRQNIESVINSDLTKRQQFSSAAQSLLQVTAQGQQARRKRMVKTSLKDTRSTCLSYSGSIPLQTTPAYTKNPTLYFRGPLIEQKPLPVTPYRYRIINPRLPLQNQSPTTPQLNQSTFKSQSRQSTFTPVENERIISIPTALPHLPSSSDLRPTTHLPPINGLQGAESNTPSEPGQPATRSTAEEILQSEEVLLSMNRSRGRPTRVAQKSNACHHSGPAEQGQNVTVESRTGRERIVRKLTLKGSIKSKAHVAVDNIDATLKVAQRM